MKSIKYQSIVSWTTGSGHLYNYSIDLFIMTPPSCSQIPYWNKAFLDFYGNKLLCLLL